ncbi:MAG: hypothetical protein JO235_17515 [Chroococcidiopsidaceae cyanobacterium CP_BM_RX_35]|nr:hypothetical protein [Chroococcidiopsidaceae cyanobacterium CP_BM_RX_35]
MTKLSPIEENGVVVGYRFYCPGCSENHALYIRPNKALSGATWDFNGDIEKPAFYPSLLTIIEQSKRFKVCHLYVRDGKLQFLTDCTHSLAGQLVEIPDQD